MVEDLGIVSLRSGRSSMCLKSQLPLRTVKEGQTYLPPCKRLGLGYPVVCLAQKNLLGLSRPFNSDRGLILL